MLDTSTLQIVKVTKIAILVLAAILCKYQAELDNSARQSTGIIIIPPPTAITIISNRN